MLTFLLLAVCQEAQATDFDHFMALGRGRSDFGEKLTANGRSWHEGSDEEIYHWSMQTMPFGGHTEMFFPVGAYDRRFYLQSSGVGPEEPDEAVHLETKGWLAYETKTGPGVGQGIEYRWKLRLVEDVPDEMPLGHGTLELILYRRGLRVVGPVPEEAKLSLKARKGFAGYWISPFLPTFYYWYVRPDGTQTELDYYFPPWPQYAWDHEMPDTPFPYVITPEERSALTKQGWKYRPPQR